MVDYKNNEKKIMLPCNAFGYAMIMKYSIISENQQYNTYFDKIHALTRRGQNIFEP